MRRVCGRCLVDQISHLQCLLSHLQSATLGLISSNEARCVHEDTALNARDLREVIVSDTAPELW